MSSDYFWILSDHALSVLHRHLQSPILFSVSICTADYNCLKQQSTLCPSFEQIPQQIPQFFQVALPWFLRWPTICTILHELDYLCHDKVPPSLPPYIGQRFHKWPPNASR
ncbi:hypothetical protein G6F37_006131 [Rhizopus arrhizus]|nr:hypothetical protein G6F38_008728 [Rhizopus arrhizus]KAG1158073.1 hypothetical protein G6F37_006131 [Rhizopus arrhizus]